MIYTDTLDTETNLLLEDMAWAKLRYQRKQINDSVRLLIGSFQQKSSPFTKDEILQAVDIIDNFRAAHAFPLNTFQIFLRTHANALDTQCIIAQRLKRLVSILLKLDRFKTMQLWDMQDIGGCRAILRRLSDIEKLVNAYKSSSIRHKLVHQDDYINQPRDSGYRGRHLVYRYYSDRNDTYNGLKIEVQIRTRLQHAWATAVETVDLFTKQALKSSRGQRDWERFFQLMGTEMAFLENTTPVPGTPTDRRDLHKELKNCADELRIKSTLTGFTTALRTTAPIKGDYFLLSLDPDAEHLAINSYSRRILEKASKDYANEEKKIREKGVGDAVLVSVDSIQNLRRAYPNYFADTGTFIRVLDKSLKL